jgi:autotransporter-associated beta strand protein
MRVMKRTIWTKLLGGLIVGTNVLALASTAVATSYYWDTNGASSGIGSAGGAAADWLTDSWATTNSGTASTAAWPNTQLDNTDEAVFQGTAGTVNLSTDVYANALSYLTRDYMIASTGGALNLAGAMPTIEVSPPSLGNNGQQTVRVSAPIIGTNGFTLLGNGQTGGFKFLQLENNSVALPNSFSGTLTIADGGSLRIAGAVDREQIPDDVDLDVTGVIDFNTSGGASDTKQEKVRNVNVNGASAIFSVGNGSDFIVNSLTGTGATNISVNGNSASVPGKLSITGWADGSGDLTLHSSSVKLNTTGSQAAIGGRIVLAGNIISTGDSQVVNNNGGGSSTPQWDDNIFTHKALDFTGVAHTIDVADGTLTFTSRAPSHPLEITATQPDGAVVTKTGPGTWRLEDAVQTADFTGATKVHEGVLSLGRPALADAADLYLESGVTLELDFSGTDVIDSLFIDGMSQATGTWGRPGNLTADFTSDLISGDGLLDVTTFVLVGDYNDDHVVDAADYTVWRNNLGSTAVLPNDRTPGMVTSEDYDDWKANFGATSTGAGAASVAASVPEPASAFTILMALPTCAGHLQRRRRTTRVRRI